MATAVTFSGYGDPDVLTLTEVEAPRPGPGQVRIRVRAVGVNPIDVKIRSGMMAGIMPVEFPHLPGWDVAGVVDAAGSGAIAEVGDEVFGIASAGGYSEYALLNNPVQKPAGLPWETAAAIITVGEAAFRVLKQLGLTAGQTLVILGAAGSVGTIAVQLARSRGLTVVGVAAEQDLERVAALGALAVPSGDGWAARVAIAAPAAVDAVFDTTGAGLLGNAVALAADPAKVITIADHHAAEHGVRFTGADPADRAPEALPELAALAAKGELHVAIWRTYPLGDAARAHADVEAGRNRGKIILLPLLPVEPMRPLSDKSVGTRCAALRRAAVASWVSGSPWPKQATATSRPASRRNEAAAWARLTLNTPPSPKPSSSPSLSSRSIRGGVGGSGATGFAAWLVTWLIICSKRGRSQSARSGGGPAAWARMNGASARWASTSTLPSL